MVKQQSGKMLYFQLTTKVPSPMKLDFYLQQFQQTYTALDKTLFDAQQIKLYAGTVLNSAVIKAYNPAWSNQPAMALTANCRIFFSVWVSEKTIAENRLYYNIHALKLRQLPAHKITSRDFAERFRKQFKAQQKYWPNVGTDFGPLTLMEGWKPLDNDSIQQDARELVQNFLQVVPVIDKTLAYYKVS